ncbi:MAG: RsmD family RNA methyltransferase [Candidatus Microsaccharimonas sp.]
MTKKPFPIVEVTLDAIVGGGQTIGTLEDGRKIFVWGGLPTETVRVQIMKKKSSYAEGIMVEVLKPSKERVEPKDPGSYLSTSPWQIMALPTENHYKAALIEEAFELHNIVLPNPIEVFSDGVDYAYRNKVEFSFWFEVETQKLSLAFFRRGSHGKITIDGTSLATDVINVKGKQVLDALNELKVIGRSLKTLLIRSSADGRVAWQLYVKDEDFPAQELRALFPKAENSEIIYSNPKSPASVITKKLTPTAQPLTDTILGVPFHYATEGFFQINLTVYEESLKDMKAWVQQGRQVVDLYSGVGTIGLTIGGEDVTLVEVNEHAVREMERNIQTLGISATAILAASEKALDYITANKTIIVDPPRAGLHEDVVEKLLSERPARIIYLSCNPVTQARDVARLAEAYGVAYHKGYNFFPHTPHIEHLVVLDLVEI